MSSSSSISSSDDSPKPSATPGPRLRVEEAKGAGCASGAAGGDEACSSSVCKLVDSSMAARRCSGVCARRKPPGAWISSVAMAHRDPSRNSHTQGPVGEEMSMDTRTTHRGRERFLAQPTRRCVEGLLPGQRRAAASPVRRGLGPHVGQHLVEVEVEAVQRPLNV
jgi:hypothetical protein